jgi:hypothetical protein
MTALVVGLEKWLQENACESVNEIRGHLDATHVELADKVLRTQYRGTLSPYISPQHLQDLRALSGGGRDRFKNQK